MHGDEFTWCTLASDKLAATLMAGGPSASLGCVAAQESAIDAESTDKSLDQLDMLHTEKRLENAIVLQSYVRMWRVRRRYALEAGAELRPRAEGREETTKEVRPEAVESRASEVHANAEPASAVAQPRVVPDSMAARIAQRRLVSHR